MEVNAATIGLQELLDEISRDLDSLRKEHPSDYGLKTVSMWWAMQRERVLSRHVPGTLVKKLRRLAKFKAMLTWFFAGVLGSSLCSALLRWLIP